MLFAPGELPVATVVIREPRARVAAETKKWAAARWSWLRPRTLPILVAVAGLVCVVASGRYLSHYALRSAPPQTASLDNTRDTQAAGDETYYLVHIKPGSPDVKQIEVELVSREHVYK